MLDTIMKIEKTSRNIPLVLMTEDKDKKDIPWCLNIKMETVYI